MEVGGTVRSSVLWITTFLKWRLKRTTTTLLDTNRTSMQRTLNLMLKSEMEFLKKLRKNTLELKKRSPSPQNNWKVWKLCLDNKLSFTKVVISYTDFTTRLPKSCSADGRH